MDTKALVTLCQKGNGQALSLLYENYSEKMLKVCLRYIPDPTIAQDLLHDGFVIIFTSIHSLRNPEKLEYWMKKIMRNLALQYLNHANANPTIPLTDIPEEEEPAENPFCPDFISYDKMLDIVESLPEGYCKVFKLAVLEGLSHKEIGDLLGIAPHSSSSQLFRAKISFNNALASPFKSFKYDKFLKLRTPRSSFKQLIASSGRFNITKASARNNKTSSKRDQIINEVKTPKSPVLSFPSRTTFIFENIGYSLESPVT